MGTGEFGWFNLEVDFDRSISVNEFTGLEFYCTPEESAASGGVCQFTTGEEWLQFRLLDDVPLWGDIAYVY